MEDIRLPDIDYGALAPMLILFGVACVGVLVEALVPRRSRHAIQLGLSRTGKTGSAKGVVVTGADMRRHRGLFRAYSAFYPALWAVSRLDLLVPWIKERFA